MDLADFERNFSAYQRRESDTVPSMMLRRQSKTLLLEKPKELSVIDGRRAQNCTILLSKLKMTDDEIRMVRITAVCTYDVYIIHVHTCRL